MKIQFREHHHCSTHGDARIPRIGTTASDDHHYSTFRSVPYTRTDFCAHSSTARNIRTRIATFFELLKFCAVEGIKSDSRQ